MPNRMRIPPMAAAEDQLVRLLRELAKRTGMQVTADAQWGAASNVAGVIG